jgi:CRP/FNR family cyclic AMP-dependent transcriptional regulator
VNNQASSLQSIELLSSLSPEELAAVEKACSWKSYAAQEQIIDRQSETSDVFFIVAGRTRVILYSLSGREVTLDDLDAGSYFGELAAIDGQPRSTSVMALTETQVATLPPSQFLDIVSRHPELAVKLMKRLAWVIRTSNERIMDLSTLGANNRVHAELLRQAKLSMNEDEGFAVISPIPVHGDVASRVSTTRETVARVFSNLTRQGVIERQKTSLLIRDLDLLQEMVEDVRGE